MHDYIMRVTPFDFLRAKWLNSHTFYELCGSKDLVKYNESIDISYLKEEEEIWYSALLGGWSNFSTF